MIEVDKNKNRVGIKKEQKWMIAQNQSFVQIEIGA